MASYTINGQPIHASEDGPPGGPLALLIHGWSSSSYALSPLVPQIARRYRTLAVDLPGYGSSPPLDTPASIPAYADLLAGLIRSVARGPAVLVGHSMGGMTAVTLALRHPELVERMVLICPTVSGKLSAFINLAIAPVTLLESFGPGQRLSRLIESQFVDLTDRLMRPASFAERSAIKDQAYRRLRADARQPGQGRVRAECYWAMRRNSLSGRLAQVEAPTLVVWGAEDNTVPLRDAGIVADEWPAADLRIIPKAGHWPQFEAPDTTRRYVAAFLGLPLGEGRAEVTLGKTVEQVGEVARFLGASEIAGGMTETQRARLAAHVNLRYYAPGRLIAQAGDVAQHLFIVQEGVVEVLAPGAEAPVATLGAGQVAGELALLDGGRRSTAMRAGTEGAVLLSLRRERLEGLCADDPALGNQVLWNIAAALARRLRRTTSTLAEER